jgi:myo-inositol catabolism protein IolC
MYLLPLDHRMPWHVAAIMAAKTAVYEGFRHAVAEARLPPGEAGVIADERSGAAILRDAAMRGLVTVCAVGAGDSGPESVACHATTCEAEYWKAVVSYNPDEDLALNRRQACRVKWLSHYLRHRVRPRLMCDLVVPPTQRQVLCGIRAYGRRVLAGLTTRAIAQLLEAGVEPDVWVIEGFEREDEYRHVVAAAAARDDPSARCVVRAAGHGDAKTRELMTAGLPVPGIAGVVLARASLWEPAVAWMSGRSSRANAVATVQAQARDWIGTLEASRRSALSASGPVGGGRSLLRIQRCECAAPGNSGERRQHVQSNWRSSHGRPYVVAGRDSDGPVEDDYPGAPYDHGDD